MYKNIIIKDLDHIDDAAEVFLSMIGDDRIFALNGKMGVGKTTFVKAVCKILKVPDSVNSPTFAIINEYHSDKKNTWIYHFDFYRIKNLSEVYDIGVMDYFDSGNLCFIEWPEKIAEILPEEAVSINMVENSDGSRILSFDKLK